MKRLADDFLKEMNLEKLPELEKYIACAMLRVTIEDNQKYHELVDNNIDNLNEVCFTDVMLQDKSLIDLVQILGYSSNEIADWFITYLEEHNIDSPMREARTLYRAIWSFLDKQMG